MTSRGHVIRIAANMGLSGLPTVSPRTGIAAVPAPSFVDCLAARLRTGSDLVPAACMGTSAEVLSPGRVSAASFPSELMGHGLRRTGPQLPRATARHATLVTLGRAGANVYATDLLWISPTPMGRLGMVPRAAAGLSLLAEELLPGGVVPAVPNLLTVAWGKRSPSAFDVAYSVRQSSLALRSCLAGEPIDGGTQRTSPGGPAVLASV